MRTFTNKHTQGHWPRWQLPFVQWPQWQLCWRSVHLLPPPWLNPVGLAGRWRRRRSGWSCADSSSLTETQRPFSSGRCCWASGRGRGLWRQSAPAEDCSPLFQSKQNTKSNLKCCQETHYFGRKSPLTWGRIGQWRRITEEKKRAPPILSQEAPGFCGTSVAQNNPANECEGGVTEDAPSHMCREITVNTAGQVTKTHVCAGGCVWGGLLQCYDTDYDCRCAVKFKKRWYPSSMLLAPFQWKIFNLL